MPFSSAEKERAGVVVAALSGSRDRLWCRDYLKWLFFNAMAIFATFLIFGLLAGEILW